LSAYACSYAALGLTGDLRTVVLADNCVADNNIEASGHCTPSLTAIAISLYSEQRRQRRKSGARRIQQHVLWGTL